MEQEKKDEEAMPEDFLSTLIEQQYQIQFRLASTRQAHSAGNSLSNLLDISKQLQEVSAKNRAIAETLRARAAAARALTAPSPAF